MSSDDPATKGGFFNVKGVLCEFAGEEQLLHRLRNLPLKNKDRIVQTIIKYTCDFEFFGEQVCILRGMFVGLYRDVIDKDIYFLNLSQMKKVFPGFMKGSIANALGRAGFKRQTKQKVSPEFVELLHAARINERGWTVWTCN